MGLKLILNGHDRELPELNAGASLTEVVTALGLKADRIAVERNGEIAPRASWGAARVSAGDKLEVVHFVGGGT